MKKPLRHGGQAHDTGLHPVYAALRRIADFLGVSVPPSNFENTCGDDRNITKAAAGCCLRVRPVHLQDSWWKEDGGPLLAFCCVSGEPVALIPGPPGRYRMFHAGDRKGEPVDAAAAQKIDRQAYSPYASFESGSVSPSQLVRFGLKRFWRQDLVFTLAAGMVGGILELAVPLATGLLFDFIVPARQAGQIVWIILLLALAGFTAFVFQVTRSYSLMRMEGKLDIGLESALWDRMLNLPVEFFHEFSAGDLANRASGITKIRKALSESAVNALLACIFSLFSLILVFIYSTAAGFALLACLLVMTAVIVILFSVLREPVKEKTMRAGRLEGLLIQLIRGYHKFVVTGSQNVAFALWYKPFSEVKRVEAEIGARSALLDVAAAVFPILSAVVFYAAAYYGSSDLNAGSYFALYAAFCTVMASFSELLLSFSGFLKVIPHYERMRPILDCPAEVNERKQNPGRLRGEITLSHAVFRYRGGSCNALDDLSLTVREGEMAALIGGSGSGKSTLFKLLLGFEQPSAGAVFYDGMDLASLDVQEVRAQIGTVIQNAQIMSDSIYKNIAGSALISIEDAWAVARLVSLDRDIEEMPMGMHTFLNEGGRTLSGGQRQKILLARALVKKPRILLLDEATSALDNTAQAVVTESLSKLNITRVVIAHRLSTVMNADTIYVLENGRIVQSGSYTQLLAGPGPFLEFARRQIVFER
ncbi:MAG: NHLP bacteriocin export ABC transporter permease/ATPase subunit [Eubacteriales bacterium]|nr:NHLP bacteriocin export ABC transporter permease/ATPase subunit [Eubacteriales bacterium]